MSIDYSFQVMENLLMIKKYGSKDDVIGFGTVITNLLCKDDRVSPDIKASYKEAMRKLDTLSFNEIKEIIDILNSYDDAETETREECVHGVDDGTAEYEAAVRYCKSKEYENAYNLFKRASELGNPKAFHEYGLCLYYGLGTKSDRVKAVKQFATASDLGVKEADAMIKYILQEKG